MQPGTILLALLSLLAVLALIVGAGRLARSGLLAPRLAVGGGRMGIVQILALDPRRRLHLIRCDDRHLLILTGGTSDQVVGWLDQPGSASVPAAERAA